MLQLLARCLHDDRVDRCLLCVVIGPVDQLGLLVDLAVPALEGVEALRVAVEEPEPGGLVAGLLARVGRHLGRQCKTRVSKARRLKPK